MLMRWIRERMSRGSRRKAGTAPAVLFIDYGIPQIDASAGARSTYLYLQLFRESGFRVKFWPLDNSPNPTATAALERDGVEVFVGARGKFKRWIRKHGRHLDYAFLNRPDVTYLFIDPLKKSSSAKCLFYGHDLVSTRLRTEANVTGGELSREQAGKISEVEADVWRKVDAIYYPSAEECSTVAAAVPRKVVRQIPVFFYTARTLPPSPTEADNVKRSGLIFVGGFLHRPNVDAVAWFVEAIYPLIRARRPELTLTLVGPDAPPQIQALAGEHVRVTGRVTDEELRRLYLSAKVSIAPLRFGAGVKGKVVEALAHQVPVVATSTAAEGVPDARQALAITDDPRLFADCVLDLCSDGARWQAAATAGRKIVDRWFTEEVARGTLGLDVPELVKPGGTT